MLVAAETPGFKDFQDLLDPAGIQLNGTGACDIRVHNPDLFRCVTRDGTLGLGEAYMDGWWDCDRIDELFCRGLSAGLGGADAHGAVIDQYLAGPGVGDDAVFAQEYLLRGGDVRQAGQQDVALPGDLSGGCGDGCPLGGDLLDLST